MILVSDYDGTLNQENISNEDVQAINTFRTQGHLFGLATGRPLNMMREELAQYNLKTDFIIGTNGGIVQLEDVFVISQIDHETLRGLITFISRYEDVMIHISNGYEYSTPIIIRNLKIDEKIPGKPEGIVNSILIRGSSDNKNRKIYQELLFQGFQDLDFFYNSFNGGIIECVSKDVSKSSTIHKVFIDRLDNIL
jgi:hydroxymethylpyrimidine pyrophosphatase-like HAD family hydrolase